MSVLVKFIDIIFSFGSLLAIILLSKPLFDDSFTPKEMPSYFFSLAAFMFSWVSFYLVVFKPIFEKPHLKLSESIQTSDPTESEKQKGWKRSWFIRLRINNIGLTTAKNCIGRLIEVRRSNGQIIEKFDPFNLYWARQDQPENFRPLDIQGNNDSFFLDIAQVKEKERIMSLRILIPTGHRLPQEHSLPEGADLPVGVYYIRVAIYSDGISIKPKWFKIEWTSDFSIETPCSITQEEPPKKAVRKDTRYS